MGAMDQSDIERILAWLVESGLGGVEENELLHGFCDRCRGAAVDLSRAIVLVDTLHPIYEGRAFRWRNDGVEESSVLEYGRTDAGEAAAEWQRSAFYYLLTTGADEVRRRIGCGDPADFLHLDRLRAAGETDYVALVQRFGSGGIIGEMDCVYSHWTTRRPSGFRDPELGVAALLPTLALAISSSLNARGTLVDVYLVATPGSACSRSDCAAWRTTSCVLWFSDLHGYSINDTAPPTRSFRC
jgi:adenylate cyclase